MKLFHRQQLENQSFETSDALQRLWKAYAHTLMQAQGLSWTQILVLYAIEAQQPIASRKLGEALHITPGAVTQFVDSLVAEGYVNRRENALDRRITQLTLTDKGTKRLKEITKKRRATFVAVFDALDDDELVKYTEYQQKIVQQLERLQQSNRSERTH